MGFLQERQIDNQLKTETDQHVHRTNFSIHFRNMDINLIHGGIDQRVPTENSQKILF